MPVFMDLCRPAGVCGGYRHSASASGTFSHFNAHPQTDRLRWLPFGAWGCGVRTCLTTLAANQQGLGRPRASHTTHGARPLRSKETGNSHPAPAKVEPLQAASMSRHSTPQQAQTVG